MIALEERLVIEGVDLRGAAVHIKENDVANLRGVMEFAKLRAAAERPLGARFLGEHGRQRDRAESAAGGGKHLPAGEGLSHGRHARRAFAAGVQWGPST